MLQHRQSRAFFSLDASLAIALLVVLGTGLLLSIGYTRRGSGELAAHRVAMSRAEAALVAIQDSPANAIVPPEVTVTDLQTPAPQGFKWVQVRAQHRGKSAQLTGLVPQNVGARP